MKALILFFFLAVTTTPQVIGFNGVHFKQSGQNYINLGWSTSLNNTQPYYNTIKQNGVVIADGYFEQYNRISIPVANNYTTATYSITQTYNGVTSAPVYTTVTKLKR
jgi:hypothetical protein